MNVLAVCESPPTGDPVHGNGSTMIPEAVLPRLGPDVTVDLVYVADRPAAPSDAVLDRCNEVLALEPRSARAELAALPFTRLPRGSWLRTPPGGREAVAAMARRADVVYVHGLHAFTLALGSGAPLVANAIDPWSVYWEERSRRQATRAKRSYDRMQARRAARLEQAMAAEAAAYVVVNRDDAQLLEQRLGRAVVAVPNGVARLVPAADGVRHDRLVVFVGSLDYPPNVAAVTTLCRDVFPEVRRRVPDARLVVAGRRPGAEVLALAGDGVEIAADVPDLGVVLGRAAVAAFPGAVGRGTKNSVLEAMAAGCAVVATPSSARGVERGDHVVVGESPAAVATAVADLLLDPALAAAVGAAGAAYATSLPTWDDAAARYEAVLTAAASGAADAAQATT